MCKDPARDIRSFLRFFFQQKQGTYPSFLWAGLFTFPVIGFCIIFLTMEIKILTCMQFSEIQLKQTPEKVVLKQCGKEFQHTVLSALCGFIS